MPFAEHIAKFCFPAIGKKLVLPGRVWAIGVNAKGMFEIAEVVCRGQAYPRK